MRRHFPPTPRTLDSPTGQHIARSNGTIFVIARCPSFRNAGTLFFTLWWPITPTHISRVARSDFTLLKRVSSPTISLYNLAGDLSRKTRDPARFVCDYISWGRSCQPDEKSRFSTPVGPQGRKSCEDARPTKSADAPPRRTSVPARLAKPFIPTKISRTPRFRRLCARSPSPAFGPLQEDENCAGSLRFAQVSSIAGLDAFQVVSHPAHFHRRRCANAKGRRHCLE